MTDEEFSAQLRIVFAREASGYLQKLQEGLADAHPHRLWRELSLAAHSLRGASRSVDFEECELLSHAVEDLFDAWEKRVVSPDEARVAQAAVDLLGELLAGVSSAPARTPEKITAVRTFAQPWASSPGTYAWA